MNQEVPPAVIVAPFDLLGTKSGGVTRIWTDIRALAQMTHVSVVFPSSQNLAIPPPKLRNISLHTYPNLQTWSALTPRFRGLFDLHTQPINPFAVRALRRAIQHSPGDPVIFAHFAPSFATCMRVLPPGRPCAYVAHDATHRLAAAVTSNWAILRYIKRIEQDAVRGAALVLACTNDVGRILSEDYGVPQARIRIIPNTVDIPPESLRAQKTTLRKQLGLPATEFIALFHANFGVIANQKALDWIVRELVPAVRSNGGRVRIAVVGTGIPAAAREDDVLIVRRDVPDIWACIRAADAEIVPLDVGSGSRLKIIECMAAGLPVISTPKGIEGISAVPGEDALFVDLEADAFLEAINSLASSPELRAQLGRNGQKLFEKEYSAEQHRARLAAAVQELANLQHAR